MSISTTGMVGAAPVDYGLAGILDQDSNISKQREATLTQQAADGLISDSYSGLGANAKTSLDLSPALTHETTWASNITTADGTLGVTQAAFTQITSIATSFYSQLQTMDADSSGSTDSVATVAAAAQQDLKQLASLLDTKDGDVYVFAGQDSSNPPVPSPDNILTSGFYTQISQAVGQLSTNGAAATAASTLAIASSNTSGTSPFSAGLSQPASTVVAMRTTVIVEDNRRVSIGLVASANAAVTSTGSSTTGSYMRDLMRALATAGSMTDAQSGTPAFQSLLSDTMTSVNGAIGAMSDEAGILGNTQASMDASATMITDTQTALTTQLSNVQEVDLAATATKLSLAQTQLQASYQMISDVSKMSLVSYL